MPEVTQKVNFHYFSGKMTLVLAAQLMEQLEIAWCFWFWRQNGVWIWGTPSLGFVHSRPSIWSVKQGVITWVHTIPSVDTNNSLRKLPLFPYGNKKGIIESVWIPYHASLEGAVETEKGEPRQAPSLVSPLGSHCLCLTFLWDITSASGLCRVVSFLCPPFYHSFFCLGFWNNFPPKYKSIVCSIIM